MNYLKISLGIFVALAASRFIPHPPNFTSLLALSFYVPAILGIRYLPVLLINNPYYFHHLFSVKYSWKSQFMPVDGKEPPMLHQWIILQLNK